MDIARDICTDSFYIVNSGLPCIAVTAVYCDLHVHTSAVDTWMNIINSTSDTTDKALKEDIYTAPPHHPNAAIITHMSKDAHFPRHPLVSPHMQRSIMNGRPIILLFLQASAVTLSKDWPKTFQRLTDRNWHLWLPFLSPGSVASLLICFSSKLEPFR